MPNFPDLTKAAFTDQIEVFVVFLAHELVAMIQTYVMDG
jgi:hypothetical protein